MALSTARTRHSNLLCLSSRLYLARIGPPLKNRKEIDDFLNNRLWSLHELLETPGKDSQIAPEIVDKMRKLSGLGTIANEDEREKLTKVLDTQMRFIEHLYSETDHGKLAATKPQKSNDNVFRLIADDFRPSEPLGLSDILQQIENLPNEVDPEKGEISGSLRSFVGKEEVLFRVVTTEVDQRKE